MSPWKLIHILTPATGQMAGDWLRLQASWGTGAVGRGSVGETEGCKREWHANEERLAEERLAVLSGLEMHWTGCRPERDREALSISGPYRPSKHQEPGKLAWCHPL